MENLMFDFNCDVAQSCGVYKNDIEYEIANYASTINVAAGFHAGDALSIKSAFLYAQNHNPSINAHIGYPDMQGFGKRKMNLDKDELEAMVIYQTCAIMAYAKTFDLEIEGVRCHGALKNELNSNEESAQIIAKAIYKINPWLNLIVQNQNTKDLINSTGLKTAFEFEFKQENSIEEIVNISKTSEIKIDTINFKSLDDIKNACNIIKPAPVNYNRVESQL